jgi:3-isopropylmalate/(R)-2-methylmalate dehydratase small subunit
VGESFAEIFFGNCVALGLPCVQVDSATAIELQRRVTANPQSEVAVDLVNMQVTCGDFVGTIAMADGPRQMFVTGQWDATGQLVAQESQTRVTAGKLPYIAWAQA